MLGDRQPMNACGIIIYERSCNVQLGDIRLESPRNADSVLLFCSAQHYLTNRDRPKEGILVHVFYKAGEQYVIALRAILSEIHSHNHFFCVDWVQWLVWNIGYFP